MTSGGRRREWLGTRLSGRDPYDDTPPLRCVKEGASEEEGMGAGAVKFRKEDGNILYFEGFA